MTAKQLILNGYLPLKNEPTNIFDKTLIETKNLLQSKRFIKKIKYNIQQLSAETKEFYDVTYEDDEEKHLIFDYCIDNREVTIKYFSPYEDIEDCNNIEELKTIELSYKNDLTGKVNDCKFSFIYLIKSSLGVKIGMANDPFSRFSVIQTGNAEKLEILHLFPLENKNCNKIEKKLHNLFKEKRLSGEWFNLNDDDVFLIESLYQTGIIYSNPLNEYACKNAIEIYKILITPV